ncbi:MAG TPA: ATP-binding protein [Terriglobales bacterium]|nr:ATP-binding protein [Terriglobales bacterium]
MASTLSIPAFLHFFLKFPTPSPLLKRIRGLSYLVYLPYLALIPYVLLNYYFWAFAPDRQLVLDVNHPVLGAIFEYGSIGYFGAGLLLLLFSYRRAGELERRKVRVILAGFLVGGLPFMLRNLFPAFARMVHLNGEIAKWYFLFAMTALLLLPFSLSYAIARYQIIPVSVIIRRGVRYLIVRRGFLVITGLLAYVSLHLLLTNERAAALARLGERTHLLVEIGAAITLIQLIRLAHRRLTPLIDRRFFRGAYDDKQILSELGQALVQVHELPELLQLVAARIQDTLHAENVTAWRLDPASGDYVCMLSLTHREAGMAKPFDQEKLGLLSLKKDALTVELMSKSNRPLAVDFPDPQSWIHARLRETRGAEHAALQTVRTVLLLPIAMNGQLQTIISLGARLGDLPYSKEDQQMLSSMLWLTAFAVENLALFERERLNQEQLRQAQKMEAVGRLAGGVAHDFNNLLTVINGSSELALRKLDAASSLRRYLISIKDAGDRAAALTSQLLAFSRKQILQPEVIKLNTIVANIDKMLKRLIGEDVDLLTVLEPALGSVLADPGQVEQILMNLAVNARDAMPKGGKLTIQTANVDLDEEYARTHNEVRPGSYVMLAVSDTGEGMSVATKDRIFEPFYTTKAAGKGTGLGLSTVYGIVKQTGGHIWVYSEVGRGTTFKVYLPSLAQEAEVPRLSPEPRELPRGSETVLLVEDDDMVRGTAKEILLMGGYEVLEASRGQEALAVAKDFAGPIHLMVTDVVMPEMNGPDLAVRMEKSFPLLKVLYMSGYTDEAIVHHGVLDEGVAFLEKPFTPNALSRKVREVLDAQAEMALQN